MKLGEAAIPCAVLSDGRRILSETGITQAILGGRSGASKRLKKASAAERRSIAALCRAEPAEAIY